MNHFLEDPEKDLWVSEDGKGYMGTIAGFLLAVGVILIIVAYGYYNPEVP